MRTRWLAPLAVTVALLFPGRAFARDWFMAPTTATPAGRDGNEGTMAAPLATLQAALVRAQPGDVIQMRAGRYPDGVWLQDKPGSPKAPVTVRAYDGDLTAVQAGGVGIMNSSYLRFEGLDFGVTNSHCVNLGGTEPSWGTWNSSHHLEFQRCRFHETDTDDKAGGDELVKGGQADYLTFEDCEIFVDDGPHTTTSMAVDWVAVNYSTIRRTYIHDFNGAGMYIKGGSQYDVLEQCVISQSRPGAYAAAVQTADGTGMEYANRDETDYETDYFVVRNNILRHTPRAGVFVADARWLWIYNNLITDVGDAQEMFKCYRAYIVEHDMPGWQEHMYHRSDHIRVFNNIFLDTQGKMLAAYGHDDGTATDWVTGNNCYWNAGKPVAAGDLMVEGKLIDPAQEPGAVFEDPRLKDPTGTATTWKGWVDLYRPTAKSLAIIDRGTSDAGARPRPAVLNDLEGNGRPRGAGWDIGPYEYPGAYVKPSAEFEAAVTVGTPPFPVQFSDRSAGAPTAWSWEFGDGTKSTAQNPAHEYTKLGTYQVRLTVSNPAGRDRRTKARYVEVAPLVASLASDVTWGAAPLTVQFTDQSSDGPTTWTWDFGDGSTSTTQSPSHTYQKPGKYAVTLTARNAAGANTLRGAQGVAAYDSVLVYPEKQELGPGTTLTSGTLSDLQKEDGAGVVLASNPADGKLFVSYQAQSGVPAERIQAIGYEVLIHTTPEKALGVHISAQNFMVEADKFPWDYRGSVTVGATDQWMTRRETNKWIYLGQDGRIGMALCGCPADKEMKDYTAQVREVRFRIYLKPSF